LLVERDLVLDFVVLAIDLDAGEALALGLLEELAVFALAPANDGGHDHDPGTLGVREDMIDDLLDALALEGAAAVRAVRLADIGVEDAEVIVDFGDGADGGAGVLADRLLFDGNRGREALDVLDLGLVHLVEEL